MSEPFRIETITAYVAIDKDGTEGIIGMTMPDGTMMPMVCADHQRAISMRPLAQAIGRMHGVRIVIAQFSVRTDLEEIIP